MSPSGASEFGKLRLEQGPGACRRGQLRIEIDSQLNATGGFIPSIPLLGGDGVDV